MFRNFLDIWEKAKQKTSKQTAKIAIVEPYSEHIVHAIFEAKECDLADFILIGDKTKIPSIMYDKFETIDNKDPSEATFKAIELVKQKKASCLMKGNISTPIFMKAILNSQKGIKATDNSLLSHCFVFESSKYNKLFIVTDAGININPNEEKLIKIIKNSVSLAKRMGINKPKVALLSAIETINPKIQSTITAQKVTEILKDYTEADVFGPLALDIAIDEESAAIKGIQNKTVAGKADILVVPFIEAGNIFAKSIIYFTNTNSGGIVLGAKVPIILLSRADRAKEKLNSIALALAVS